MRAGIEVRPAEPGDLDDLVALCLAARQESSVASQVCSSDGADLAQQLGVLASVPGGSVLVAVSDGAPVGLLLARVIGPNLFTDEVSVAVEALYVAPDHRRRGVGHALMQGLAEVAAAAGAGNVFAEPIPGARGMQRFFVQLGFAPAAAHRVTSTASLQRRLAQEVPGSGRRGARGLEDLIARRRQTRGATQEIEVVSASTVEPQAGRRAGISMHVRRAVQTRLDVESSTTTS